VFVHGGNWRVRPEVGSTPTLGITNGGQNTTVALMVSQGNEDGNEEDDDKDQQQEVNMGGVLAILTLVLLALTQPYKVKPITHATPDGPQEKTNTRHERRRTSGLGVRDG